jgi:outer membrane protein assembly factor BamB
LLPQTDGLPLEWGNLIVTDDVIVGTAVATIDTPRVLSLGRDFSSHGHDYTGPQVSTVLQSVGVANEAEHVFALGKQDGRPRWVYRAAGAVPHNGIAVWKDRVYLLDKPGVAKTEQAGRRGEQIARKSSIRVLDLATGKVVGSIDEGVEEHVGLRVGSGILLATHLKGLSAYDAKDGKKLWSAATSQPMHHCSAHLRVPVITSNRVFDEPNAYDVRTGNVMAQWKWGGFRGCGTVSASEHLLLFRGNLPTIRDISGRTGRHDFSGIRPGCFINMITACGLVLMPEASSGCGCAYNFQTTIVMAPSE